MLSGINAMMWKTQDFLHKKPQIVPGALLTLAGSLVLFRHMTHEKAEWQDDSIKTFLAMILVQMLPLVALEMKIMSCADPVGLFCKFATPVTLIHAVFLGMRLIQHYLSSETIWDDTAQMLTAGLGFAGALMTMTLGFRQSLANIVLCKSVWGLMVLGFVAAFATNMLDSYLQPAWKARSDWSSFNSDVFTTANSYIEILAFVPAVLMVYREGGSDGPRFHIESCHTKRGMLSYVLTLGKASKNSRDLIYTGMIVMLVVEVSLSLQDVTLPEWFLPAVTEHEIVWLLHSLFPAYMNGCRCIGSFYYKDVEEEMRQALAALRESERAILAKLNEIVDQVNNGGGSGKPATKKPISALVKETVNPEPQAASVLTPQASGQKSANMGFYLMIAGYIIFYSFFQ